MEVPSIVSGEAEMERVARLAAELPEVEVSTWYGTPALKVRGKGFARLKAPGVLVLLCPLDLKEALIEADPTLFYETPHYEGWPAMLVRLGEIDDEQLRNRLECAWREKAPPKLAARWEQEQ